MKCQFKGIRYDIMALEFSHSGAFCEQEPACWIHAAGKKLAICLQHATQITSYEHQFHRVPTRFEQFSPITSKERSGGCLRGGTRYKRHNLDEDGNCKGCGKQKPRSEPVDAMQAIPGLAELVAGKSPEE